MRRVDAFAHILPPRYLERLEKHLEKAISADQLRYYREGVFRFDSSISDLDARWRSMDRFGDYWQVLVLAVPPLEEVGPPRVAADFARMANDEMASLVARHPDRFAAFAASLPLHDIDASLLEMDRAVGDMGALGVQVFTNVQNVHLDDPRFEPLFARLEELDRVVWLHPTGKFEANYGLWWSLGWPYETAAALSRLVYSGVMERHPGLKVIAHHGAGMVPHFSARLGMGPGYRQVKDTLPRPPLDYFRMFFADTALFGAPHAVRCVLEFFGPSHVLFGTDTPLGPANTIEATIEDIDAACLDPADRDAVFSGNARRLLGLS
jgi:predicted TIM-barrel fold metal-dependent hydrolase